MVEVPGRNRAGAASWFAEDARLMETMTVAKKKRAGRQTNEPPAFGPGRKRGHVKALVRLRPDQLKGLRVEATKRTLAIGARRVDVSEVLREAVDAWLSRRGGR